MPAPKSTRSEMSANGPDQERYPLPPRSLAFRKYTRPEAFGLFDPVREHDACGVGFIVDLKNRPSHKIVENGLAILENLEHRGAVGADPLMGDGAGIMVQIPHAFFVARDGASRASPCPRPGALRRRASSSCRRTQICAQDGEGRRKASSRTRARPCSAGATCRPTIRRCRKAPEIVATEPYHRQVIIGRGTRVADDEAFERKLYIIRKVCSGKIYSAYEGKPNDFYVVSMSCRTLIYKGMFLAAQLARLLHRPARPRFRFGAGARAPALFDQHLPELAARAPLPLRLPQRRNQHGARQRQLDGGAPGLGQLRRCSAPTSRSSGRSPIPASRTPPASTTRSNS